MIWFFNLEKASAVFCDNYDDLFQYIHELEELKPLKKHPKLDSTCEQSNSFSKDTKTLKKQWCLEYSKNHNYIVIENSPPANKPPTNPRFSESYRYPSPNSLTSHV